MVALLTVTPGCSSGDQARSGHVHIDRNNDGYCDEDGDPMPRGSGSGYYGGSHYYGTYGGPSHYGGTTSGQPAGTGHAASISSGSHGGIGSSHSGGGG